MRRGTHHILVLQVFNTERRVFVDEKRSLGLACHRTEAPRSVTADTACPAEQPSAWPSHRRGGLENEAHRLGSLRSLRVVAQCQRRQTPAERMRWVPPGWLLSPFGDREVPTDGGSRPRVFRTGAIGFVAAVVVQRRVRSSKLVCGTTRPFVFGVDEDIHVFFYFDSKYPIRNIRKIST